VKTVLAVTLALAAVGAAHAGVPGAAIPVPEPSDAILVLMGAAGIFVGRRLHARQTNKDSD
jgi:hypothetical protein